MTGFIATPSMQDIRKLSADVQQLRIIIFSLLDPEVAERFRVEWFGNGGRLTAAEIEGMSKDG